VLALKDPSSYCFDVPFEALFVGHDACRGATGSSEDGVLDSLAGAHAVRPCTRYVAERQEGHITHVTSSTTTTRLTE
jgi:hypothetical protein